MTIFDRVMFESRFVKLYIRGSSPAPDFRRRGKLGELSRVLIPLLLVFTMASVTANVCPSSIGDRHELCAFAFL